MLKSVVRAHNEYELAWTALLGLKDVREGRGRRQQPSWLLGRKEGGRAQSRDGTRKEGDTEGPKFEGYTEKPPLAEKLPVVEGRGWRRQMDANERGERGRQGRHANFCMS